MSNLRTSPSKQQAEEVVLVNSVHEAGHAASAILLDLPFKRAEVHLDAQPDFCQIDFPKGDWTEATTTSALENYVVYLVSGAIAEELVLGKKSSGDGNDREQADVALIELKRRHCSQTPQEPLLHYQDRARTLLASNKQFVEAIAKELRSETRVVLERAEQIRDAIFNS